jgi:hypothetical protein
MAAAIGHFSEQQRARKSMASVPFHQRLASALSLRTIWAIAALCAWAVSASAGVIDADPANYESVITGLAAGDTLRLASGTYSGGLSLSGKSGTASQPIVVIGPDDHSAVFVARNCCNTVQLDGASYVQVWNLTLDGGMRGGVSAVDARGSSHHITLDNLKIFGRAGAEHAAGISTSGRASNWVIRRNVIVGAGTGLRLGTADGREPFVTGLIEYNTVLDTIGDNIQIGRDPTRAVIMGAVASDRRTIIRHNVFSKRTAVTASTAGDGSYASYDNVYESAAGAQGPVSKSLRIAAAAVTPTVTMNASPGNVAAGGTSVISWMSTNAVGCSASGGWMGTKGPSGSETAGPLQSTTSYQLTCLGEGGNANAIVQVTVGGNAPPPANPPPSPTPDPPAPTPPDPTPPAPTPPPADPTPPPADPTPPPADPTPPAPPSPAPPDNPPPTGGAMSSSGGGGRLDALAIACLALIAWHRHRRTRAPAGGASVSS